MIADREQLETLARLDNDTVLLAWLDANYQRELKTVFGPVSNEELRTAIGRAQGFAEVLSTIKTARQRLTELKRQTAQPRTGVM